MFSVFNYEQEAYTRINKYFIGSFAAPIIAMTLKSK